MTRRGFLGGVVGGITATALPRRAAWGKAMRAPNIVLILTDDQGYGDAGCTGATGFETPNLDRLSHEGMRFGQYYSPHASCSPSRAGLLTGCYAQRIGIPEVLGPANKIGLSSSETTIAQMLKPLGYRTACFGKWHLGHLEPFLPTNHGFDEFFGLPYSNDMWPHHPDTKQRPNYPELHLLEGTKPVQAVTTQEDQDQLTTLYTERAVKFIKESADRSFFLYLAHSMPHVPLGCSSKFRGKSRQGLYGDVIMEIDWSVGQVLAALAETGVDRDTLVIYTSDNGPWLSYGEHAGSAGPFREGKGTTFDGGQREISLMRWPGTIPAGAVCSEPCMGIDVLPTIAEITGAALPTLRLDGLSILPLLKGRRTPLHPNRALFFHYASDGHLEAVRQGKWKLHFPHGYITLGGKPGGKGGRPAAMQQAKIGLELFDLEADIGEKQDVSARHKAVVEKLVALGLRHAEELNRNMRPPGRVA